MQKRANFLADEAEGRGIVSGRGAKHWAEDCTRSMDMALHRLNAEGNFRAIPEQGGLRFFREVTDKVLKSATLKLKTPKTIDAEEFSAEICETIQRMRKAQYPLSDMTQVDKLKRPRGPSHGGGEGRT